MARAAILEILREPARITQLDGPSWNNLLVELRNAHLLEHVAADADRLGLTNALPSKVADQLAAARLSAEAGTRMLRWESDQIAQALTPAGIEVVLMKGASYVMAGLPLAAGRSVSDIDILVRPEQLNRAESVLKAAGWEAVEQDPREHQHARRWLHQIPSLRHATRGSVVDVHHAISPPRGQLRVDTSRLFAVSLPTCLTGIRIPAQCDMILIAATHLMRNAEVAHALRDLVDLDMLLRHVADEAGAWQALLKRAADLGLSRALVFGAYGARRLLDTPLPPRVEGELRREWPFGAGKFLLDLTVGEAYLPDGLQPARATRRLARWVYRARALRVQLPVYLMASRTLKDRLGRLKGPGPAQPR